MKKPGLTQSVMEGQTRFFLFFNNFIYLFIWAMLGLCFCEGFSLIVVSGVIVAMHRLLIPAASFVVEHGL